MNDPVPEAPSPCLCAPAPELTCFGCCPPIRPAGYDHLDHVGSIRRELLDNRRSFLRQGPSRRPIVGFTCWALGYLDTTGRRVGCLLHPAGNNGEDLRFLIDYGDKCRREACQPARQFQRLPVEGRLFWLPLAGGLNPFLFSSPRANPLFQLLMWGPAVLESIRLIAEEARWTSTELLGRHPFLLEASQNARTLRYPARLILDAVHPSTQVPAALPRCCLQLWQRIVTLVPGLFPSHNGDPPGAVYVHTLSMPDDYLDMLRFGLGRKKMDPHQAAVLEGIIQSLVPKVIGDFPPLRLF